MESLWMVSMTAADWLVYISQRHEEGSPTGLSSAGRTSWRQSTTGKVAHHVWVCDGFIDVFLYHIDLFPF